ncbi:MAG: hypothetical protein BroJett040_04590 [Oligoflexia bacterium]|nr:MAG: hypothetical protein BroJett040_04590 [Oligoflexia bacterium]
MIFSSQSSQVVGSRLVQGADLKKSLVEICRKEDVQAGAILTAVGSLSQLHIRLAGARDYLKLQGVFEIQSLTGTLGQEGLHLHLTVSDREGNLIGGHLMDENIVHTTSECLIIKFEDLIFQRRFDPQSGFKELIVEKN